jgi:hypothetical protein
MPGLPEDVVEELIPEVDGDDTDLCSLFLIDRMSVRLGLSCIRKRR